MSPKVAMVLLLSQCERSRCCAEISPWSHRCWTMGEAHVKEAKTFAMEHPST